MTSVPRKAHALGPPPKFSVIIPAYNEEKTIVRVVEEVLALKETLDLEVIVVDDGSTDLTVRRVRENFSEVDVHLVRVPINKGKGNAMREGLAAARGEYVVYQDADLEYPPSNILTMADCLKPETDMVIGVRTVNAMTLAEVSICSLVCNKLFIRLLKVPDVWSGHRIIRRQALIELDLKTDRFEIETVLTIRAIKRKWHLEFQPISYLPRNWAEGKKIGTVDFFKICHVYAKEMWLPWPS